MSVFKVSCSYRIACNIFFRNNPGTESMTSRWQHVIEKQCLYSLKYHPEVCLIDVNFQRFLSIFCLHEIYYFLHTKVFCVLVSLSPFFGWNDKKNQLYSQFVYYCFRITFGHFFNYFWLVNCRYKFIYSNYYVIVSKNIIVVFLLDFIIQW